MRKKELLETNEKLFAKNGELLLEIKDLKKEISQLKIENAKLISEKESLSAKLNATEPLRKLEEKVTSKPKISEDTAYGSTVIGQIVVLAAKHCGNLGADSENQMAKEQVNLILGRTEIAKSEILKIVSSASPIDEKKRMIDSQKKSAEDYFISVMAQNQ